jgi:hypothetical protein
LIWEIVLRGEQILRQVSERKKERVMVRESGGDRMIVCSEGGLICTVPWYLCANRKEGRVAMKGEAAVA